MGPLGKFKLALRRMIMSYTSVISIDILGAHSVLLVSFSRRSAQRDGSISRISTLTNSYVSASFSFDQHAMERKKKNGALTTQLKKLLEKL